MNKTWKLSDDGTYIIIPGIDPVPLYYISETSRLNNDGIDAKNSVLVDKEKIGIGDKRKIENEPKLKHFPFSTIEVSNVAVAPFVVHPNLLFGLTMNFKHSFAFTPEVYKHFTSLESGIYSRDNIVNRFGLIVETNYTLPIDKDAWKEYVSQHKISNITGQISAIGSGLTKVGGGAIAGAMKGGIGGAVAGGITGAVSGGLDIMNFYAQRGDIKNRPDVILKTSSNLALDFMVNDLKDKCIFKELLPKDKQIVADHLHLYGYNLNNTLKNINDLLDTRYYFNYIQATNTFEVVKKSLSADIKQQIDDTLSGGVRVWNYRGKDTWKGIKNYDYENWEMRLLT